MSRCVVTYDEFGGSWDHVPVPGTAGNPSPHDAYGPGTRVPALVVSPLLTSSGVDHTQYDTTSILATIEHRFDVPPLRDATGHKTSDAKVNDLAIALTPRGGAPPLGDRRPSWSVAARGTFVAARSGVVALPAVAARSSAVLLRHRLQQAHGAYGAFAGAVIGISPSSSRSTSCSWVPCSTASSAPAPPMARCRGDLKGR